jgi:hypothetical protein
LLVLQYCNIVLIIFRYIKKHDEFSSSCTVYVRNYPVNVASLSLAIQEDFISIRKLIINEINMKNYAKISLIVFAEFIQVEAGEIVNTITMPLRSNTVAITRYDNIRGFIDNSEQTIQNRIDDFLHNGSNYVLRNIVKTHIEFAKCKPLNGSCGKLAISDRKNLSKLMGVASGDKNCFFYAVARHFVQTDIVSSLKLFIKKHVNVTGIKVPVKVNDVGKFEILNKHLNIKINILFAEGEDIYPLYVSKNVNAKNTVNILLYKEVVNGRLIPHYVYINNLSKFLRKKYHCVTANGKATIYYEKTAVCPNCLCKFSGDAVMKSHLKVCAVNIPQKIRLAPAGSVVKFTHHEKSFKMPIVGFYDFECYMKKPVSSCLICDIDELESCVHKSAIECEQCPMTYSLLLLDNNSNIIHFNTYSGEDCSEMFLNELLDLEPVIEERLSQNVPMKLSKAEEDSYLEDETCHICGDELTVDRGKVRDHCHLTG